MNQQQELILVSAPNKAGEAFIRELLSGGLPFAVLVNNKGEKAAMERLGVKTVLTVSTLEETTWIAPPYSIGKVFLFETSLNLCCRYVRICRPWTSQPVYVITKSSHPRLIYKALGADYVIHTNRDEVSFLIQALVG
ncbi:hypothetical protein LJK88_45865 [Paenibacillus sp. P26]|nr:hypothetical protein LJK88_45865 [Paenibacillus sp. P26]UUZ92049.1 hypothetical protein LJK87_42485 [Paenibacillus sp. P25]